MGKEDNNMNSTDNGRMVLEVENNRKAGQQEDIEEKIHWLIDSSMYKTYLCSQGLLLAQELLWFLVDLGPPMK